MIQNAPAPEPARRALLQGRIGQAIARQPLVSRLRSELQGEVLFDAASRGRYSTDASIYQVMPIGVAVPRSLADLGLALDIARDAGVAILPRGGGTSQCGQTVGEALVLDTSRHLRGIRDLDVDARTVTVEPGVVLDHLNQFLKPHGLWFPVDVSTAAQCTIGGMAGNNSCGSRSLFYGNMVHNVEAIDAILDDGTRARFARFGDGGPMALSNQRMRDLVSGLFQVAESVRSEVEAIWPKVMRRVGGYNLDVFFPQSERPYNADGSLNLAQLLVGSEGTLATFESLTLRLAPIPKHKVLGVVNFASFQKAMLSTARIVELGPVAVELVDRTMIELCRVNPVFAPVIQDAVVPVNGAPTDALLLVEFAGEDLASLERRLRELETLMADLGQPQSVVAMTDAKRQSALWEVRKAGLNIMMSLKGDGKPVSFIEDCAVPLEHLADYTDALTEVFARHGTQGTWYAHASVGTLHVRPILDMRRDGAEKMRSIAQEASTLVRRFKGAFSGEHGDGLVRSEWVSWQFGPRITQAFEQVKDLFDPANRLNPGKIVRPSRMDDRNLFRYSPGYAALPMATGLDWSAWNVKNDPSEKGDPGTMGIRITEPGSGGDPTGGLAKAVEMCNNNGHCRKFDAGTMCPSYRVTRQEIHSVRGRANTLRLAVSGQLPSGIVGSEVEEALDLCVGCKGCQRECPTGVDMARMKIEAAYQRGKSRGFSLKDRAVAGLPRIRQAVRDWPVLATVFNLRNRLPLVARLMQRLVGIAAERPLPNWHSKGFAQLRRQAQLPEASFDECDLILWADTFSESFSPAELVEVHRMLHGMGFAVAWSGAAGHRPLCCGRTALSVGMIDEAKAQAVDCLEALGPALDRGVPIVGFEPSCLLSIRDEWRSYGLGGAAQQLAKQTFLFEEWWVAQLKSGRIQPTAHGSGLEILVHGHCHQKAQAAISPTLEALRAVGAEVTLIESSCCGMAGSFGYEDRHQEVSKAMAELSLLPALRKAPASAWIVADGFSCRHQIADLSGLGAERQPMHAAVALARILARPDPAHA